jgi:LacI family transcriptional regulator
MKKYNLPLDEDLIIQGGFSEEDGVLCAHRLLELNKKLPDAIFAVNDPMAIGALTCFKENGIKIPDHIALAGFSDDRVSSFITPSLTTVRQPTYEMGKLAMKRLINDVERKSQEELENTIVLKPEIVIRDST